MLARLLLLSCFSLWTSAIAQSRNCDEACAIRTYLDPARSALQHQLGRFKPYVEKDAPYLFEKGGVRVGAYADFNAYADYSNRQILLPAQFVLETSLLCEATARATLDKSHIEDVKLYQKYLVRRSQRARINGEIDKVPVKNYAKFIGESDKKHAEIDSPELRSHWSRCNYEALSFVLAHEIGHMVLGHRSDKEITPKQSRAQEKAADQYSIDLTQKAGMDNIAGGASVLMRFAVSDAVYGATDESSRTHPLTECRFYRFTNPEIIRNGASEEFRKNLQATGQSLTSWRREWKELGAHCEKDDN